VEWSLTAEQESFRKVVRDFADQVIGPRAYEMDQKAEFPVDIARQMGELGLFGLPFAEEYGGAGADYLTYCLAIEEIARVDSSMAITLEAGVSLGAAPFAYFGTEEQKQEWLVPMCAGEILGAFGLTEPDAGSDAGATRTKAVEDGDEWVIDGHKAFITNSGTPLSRVVTITAATGPGPELTSIAVPHGTPGFAVGPAYKKMGWRASDTHGLVLEQCRVPVANTVGARGKGLANFLHILDEGRIAIAALAVGLAQACLEESTAYAKTRVAFGQPIGHFQGVSFKIADMAVAVENGRNLVWKAAHLRDSGRTFRKEAAMAKLYATEMAVSAARDAVQVQGGYGFMDEAPVSRYYRDSKVLEIGEGTSEIQRLVISRELGL
jgi:alkylation response protein AidB-like acyl-CoA dehydrogenase